MHNQSSSRVFKATTRIVFEKAISFDFFFFIRLKPYGEKNHPLSRSLLKKEHMRMQIEKTPQIVWGWSPNLRKQNRSDYFGHESLYWVYHLLRFHWLNTFAWLLPCIFSEDNAEVSLNDLMIWGKMSGVFWEKATRTLWMILNQNWMTGIAWQPESLSFSSIARFNPWVAQKISTNWRERDILQKWFSSFSFFF